jgi:predicted transcriptional regulator
MNNKECLKILSCDSKKAIIKLLIENRFQTPTQLSETLGIALPTVSSHLKELTIRGIITNATIGKTKKFYVLDEALESIEKCLSDISIEMKR